MKFSIGYQENPGLQQSILRHLDAFEEVYFGWGKFSTGRGVMELEDEGAKTETLKTYRAAGLKLNWLLNGNCYGRQSQGRKFFQTIGDTADKLRDTFGLTSVTTTSPIIAKFLKMNFSDLEVRASVNMEIGTIEGIEYLLENYDSFYLKREYNYDLDRIRRIHRFCEEHGRKLYLLANSGCLNYCSARTFHDNLVAHQHEISEMDNAFEFQGLCHEWLKDRNHQACLLQKGNFIRPEDVHLYEGLCNGMKLATRTNRNPVAVAEAYARGRWNGNLLDLTEPSHAGSYYPQIISNQHIASGYAEHRLHCDKHCETCTYCQKIQQAASLTLSMENIDNVNE